MLGDLITILGNNLINVLGIFVTVFGFVTAFSGAAARIERTLRRRFKGDPSRLASLRFGLHSVVNLVTVVVVIAVSVWLARPILAQVFPPRAQLPPSGPQVNVLHGNIADSWTSPFKFRSPPWHMTTGPDGALWLTERDANQIGRVTANGQFTEYPVPTAQSGPSGITLGPDGNLWFTESTANKIGRVALGSSVKITEYRVPTPHSSPEGITTGPDGNLWFTEANGNTIGHLT
jgi:hypothetical protein